MKSFSMVALLWFAGFLGSASSEGLRILLTNDDGYKARGIGIMHRTLVAAGHDVTTVAPLGKQSGASSKVTMRGKGIAFVEQSPSVWSIDGAPADCVAIGLTHILKESPPDLVVSGPNFGGNLGADVNFSGTVEAP